MKKIGQALLSDPNGIKALKEKIIQLRVAGTFKCWCGKIHGEDWKGGCIEIDWENEIMECNLCKLYDHLCIPDFLQTKFKNLMGWSGENLSPAEQFLVEVFVWRRWLQLLKECKKSEGYEMDSREEAEQWFRKSNTECKIFSVFLLGKDMRHGAQMHDAWCEADTFIDIMKANLYFGSGINRVVYIEGIGYAWRLSGFSYGTPVMFKVDADGFDAEDLDRYAEHCSDDRYKKLLALKNREKSWEFVGGFESVSPKELLW
jgi:hypothetical protein